MPKLLATLLVALALATTSARADAVSQTSAAAPAHPLPAPLTRAASPAQSLAQAFGTHCSSGVGICPIVPAPIGFYCQCGTYPGTVVP